MSELAASSLRRTTHEVTDQAVALEDVNLFESDVALGEALEREGGGWAIDRVGETGAVAGSAEAIDHGRRAERHEPCLATHDRFGNRVTRWSTTRAGTGSCAARSSARSTRCRGVTRGRAHTSPEPRSPSCGRSPTPG